MIWSLPLRYCKTLDDLRDVQRSLRDITAQRDYLRAELARSEQDNAALSAGNVELQRLVDKLVEERDEAQGAVLGAELELMRRGIG